MTFNLRQRLRHLLGFLRSLSGFLCSEICFGSPGKGPAGSIVLFPYMANRLNCGLAGVVSFKGGTKEKKKVDIDSMAGCVREIGENQYQKCLEKGHRLEEKYLGGIGLIESFKENVRAMKTPGIFIHIYNSEDVQKQIADIAAGLGDIIEEEVRVFSKNMGHMPAQDVSIVSKCIEDLKDIKWCLDVEISENITRVKELISGSTVQKGNISSETITIFKKINAVFNSIDRLEVRGRDSAGISLMFILQEKNYKQFQKTAEDENLIGQIKARSEKRVLINNGITIRETRDEKGRGLAAVNFTFKVAAEIGGLGDNIQFLREQIKNDQVFQTIVNIPVSYHSVSAHTRWASVGAITEANCHPLDNRADPFDTEQCGIIHACLNGDIDNYLDLKKECDIRGCTIPVDITTDTKIIPMQIEYYLKKGVDITEAFRLAVNDFEGSHAISMHTDLAPGKLFLAQKGSGQAVFVGLAEDHYMPTSEVYGFVEETSRYLKLDGEKTVDGKNGKTQGQIIILDQESPGGLKGIASMYYDGTPINLGENDIKHTEITSRDIDRQGFPHYFLKEISESPLSVERTLQNRWRIEAKEDNRHVVQLDETVVPMELREALVENRIKRIFFLGQGTAGVAALACSDILNYYLGEPLIQVCALKASELSGFKLSERDAPDSMEDTLVIAISQSGTTTDTNRTVDMVRARGAYTLAIVNRRDSDITFKVNGVFYTSSGRDIEMSVASTKAFYSQIVAGAVLGLFIAAIKGSRDKKFINDEIKQLLVLPHHMQKVLSLTSQIETSAKRLAATRTYWAAVGSGPNKASADEIRIKLSELCYKTISSDFVEDKKHIDLSSEPLIIICAAGARATVINDIVKDTAIFKAHKAAPVVIADEGEDRFAPYAEDVFHVPQVDEHLAPVLNTLAGHIWGYYAALSINEGSRLLYGFREKLQKIIDDQAQEGLDVYDIVLEKAFREEIVRFYKDFRSSRDNKRFPTKIVNAADLTLLLKYLSGRLPVTDFEIDFGIKGTALNMLKTMFEFLSKAINNMARPIDAIKHQAKTVTVGTSRISEKVEGVLFDALDKNGLSISQLMNRNVIVLKNLQEIVSEIKGSILYKIGKLNILGEPVDDSTIEILEKTGVLAPIQSRVEQDNRLKGTKKIIVRQGNVYIGKGRKDDRSIIVVPAISASSRSNLIENLLLLNVGFKESIPIPVKIRALGGKFEHIKNIVQENSVAWDDRHIEIVDTEELFGRSAEKIGEHIVSRISGIEPAK